MHLNALFRKLSLRGCFIRVDVENETSKLINSKLTLKLRNGFQLYSLPIQKTFNITSIGGIQLGG